VVHRVPPGGSDHGLDQLAFLRHEVHAEGQLGHLLDDGIAQAIHRLPVSFQERGAEFDHIGFEPQGLEVGVRAGAEDWGDGATQVREVVRAEPRPESIPAH